jgi:ribokinase
MNVAFIAPYGGKQKFQAVYDAIIAAIEHAGVTVISPEKSEAYHSALDADSRLRDAAKAHYEFIRKAIIDSDAVIVEASWEDFRVGHETSLALLYRKPVLALSQSLDLNRYIHHPGFHGIKYTANEIPRIVETFLTRVQSDYLNVDYHHRNRPTIWPTKPRSIGTIVVFGGVLADIFNRVPTIPREDEVVLSSAFKILLGGKATNAAVAMARMDNEVLICGRVGHDMMGSDLESILIHEGIKTDFLARDIARPTGTVTLAVDDRAKYSTIVHEAASVLITKEAVDNLFEDVDEGKLHLSLVYLTLEPPPEIVAYIIREATKRQVFVFCDAAPHTRPLDLSLLPLVDIVAPNQLEAKAMTNIEVRNSSSARQAVDMLAKHGAKRVIITMGEQGGYYYDVSASPSLISFDAFKVKAIDEAAAGDAFRAAIVSELLHSGDAQTALTKARIAGAFAVTRFGSYDSMPTSEELALFSQRSTLRSDIRQAG